ncbi:flagellar hook-length control protein FliK [Noviherbaspirillum cavernae]|uniref:Flagellar hook-length control protein FliK n=2 Tax=Noviherbaspirillum cavernae TaxID=2320862 RepID=A0A418WWG0_9BURK|nr:flagellar hook-length control protein FliK [Noviherbaspirillum cavernae]
MHAEGGDTPATAHGETQDEAALTDAAMPLVLDMPALAMAASDPAIQNGTTAAAMVQFSTEGVAMLPDADPALKAQMPQAAILATNPGAQATPAEQGAAQMTPITAMLSDSTASVNMQLHRVATLAASANANPATPLHDASRLANVREADAASAAVPRGNVGGSADFAPTFNTVAATASAANGASADTLKLAGAPAQWQQPLREALGERLQVQLGRNSEHAVIRLDPPMLGRIEISIRHEAGALQVHMSASNGEVLRQLHGIGDGLRQDLVQRQYNDVAVVVSASPRQGDAESAGRQRQGNPGQEDKTPGRALADADQEASAYAFLKDLE